MVVGSPIFVGSLDLTDLFGGQPSLVWSDAIRYGRGEGQERPEYFHPSSARYAAQIVICKGGLALMSTIIDIPRANIIDSRWQTPTVEVSTCA